MTTLYAPAPLCLRDIFVTPVCTHTQIVRQGVEICKAENTSSKSPADHLQFFSAFRSFTREAEKSQFMKYSADGSVCLDFDVPMHTAEPVNG